jgi:hypothetical protein
VVQVHPPESARGGVEVLFHAVFAGDVGRHPDALAWQLAGHPTRPVAVEVDDHHPAAFLGQPTGRRRAKPARPAGHDRHFARKAAEHARRPPHLTE